MRRVILVLPLLAGLAAALALTMPSIARAWDINALPTGYSIVGHIKNGDCTTYQVRGYGAAIDLSSCRPDFQDALDAWVEATCPQDVCHPAPPVTTTVDTTPVTTTADPVPVTTTTAATVDPAVTTTAAAPVTPPTVTQTIIVETTITDPSITQRLDLLEQRQATDEARLAQLEKGATPGLAPLGEPKNLSPFVA